MSTPTAMAKQNMDSSILFMQQEHAAILKGLHEEIAILQKRCTDLTFQLTMHGLTIDEPDAVDTKMQQVHLDLEMSKEKITGLEKALSERDKKIERLETEARSQRKRWLDETRAQSQAMNALKAELEAKANNIAYLTTELHRLKQRSKQEQAGEAGAAAPANVSHGRPSHPGYLNPDSAQSNKRTQHFLPAPPAREKTLGPNSAASRIRRSAQGSKSSILSAGVSGKTIGVASQSADAKASNPLRLSSGRSSGSNSPDISQFLPKSKEEPVAAVSVKQAPILPPISATAATHSVLVHKVVASQGQKNLAPNPAIETLAVENVAPVWPMAQESQGAEYN